MTETAAVSFLCVVLDNSGGQDTSWPWMWPWACGDGACGPAPWSYCRNKSKRSKRRKRDRLTKYGRWKNLRPCTCCPPGAERYMDSKLWSTLPSDLVQKVLERLPAPNQVQSQTVCKKWRSLLTDPLFLQESAFTALSSRLGQSVCLVWQGVQTDLDPTQRHHLPHLGSGASRPSGADVLPHVKKLKLDPDLPSVESVDGAQCEGWFATHLFQQNVDEMKRRKELGQVTYDHVWENGLLCMWCCDTSTRPHGLYICLVNPVNRTWMDLPCLATVSQHICIIVVPGRASSEFRVMVRSMKCPRAPDDHGLDCENCRYWPFNVYCSRSGAWSETTTEHQLDSGREASFHLFADSHVFANGMLYATCGNTFGIGSKLIILSGEDGQVVKELTELKNEEPQGKWQSYGAERLVEHKGDVYCVANTINIFRVADYSTLTVQKLDECNSAWDFVSSYNFARITNCQYPAGSLISAVVVGSLVSAVVVGNSIYATIRYHESGFSEEEPFRNGVILLSYDIEDGTWRSICIPFDNMTSNYTLFAPRPDLCLPRQL